MHESDANDRKQGEERDYQPIPADPNAIGSHRYAPLTGWFPGVSDDWLRKEPPEEGEGVSDQ